MTAILLEKRSNIAVHRPQINKRSTEASLSYSVRNLVGV